ncbi:hypothetical protein TNCV_2555411 [Trichonephila clavipes]|nr:hypothetical protein TNCV_2555411 [Trichonephila clavipes]
MRAFPLNPRRFTREALASLFSRSPQQVVWEKRKGNCQLVVVSVGSWVRVPEPLEICRVEKLMHVHLFEAQCSSFGVMLKFEEWVSSSGVVLLT